MSTWPSQGEPILRRYTLRQRGSISQLLNRRSIIKVVLLICLLAVQGIAIVWSDLWAAPVVLALIVALAGDLPLMPLLSSVLLVRVLTDETFSKPSAGSGTVNVSGGIAVLLILLAVGLLLRRRQGVMPACLAWAWLSVWTFVAIGFNGASSETVRQGIREAAIVAVAVIVCNSGRAITSSSATRLIQLLGFIPAILAIYQFATHTGVTIEGHNRAYGTFNHPDGAAMFFAIAAISTIWQYVENGRRRRELALLVLFIAATIATFSLTALASLLAMLIAFATLRPGAYRVKVRVYAAVALIVAAFLATPFGAARIANETSTQINSSQTHVLASTSLGWRIYKWGTLIPQWERSPVFGNGLGTTVSAEGDAYMFTTGKAPHNEYLRYLVETGIVGLAILLWSVGYLIRRLNTLRRVQGLNVGHLGLAVVVGCLVNALADNTFLYTTTGYAAALVVAAVLSVPRSAGSQQPPVEERS